MLVDADIKIKKNEAWSWQTYQEFECSDFDLLGVGKGLKAINQTISCGNDASSCAYNLESDFRIEKVGIACSGQEGEPNKGIKNPDGYRTDYLQFGDNIKVSTDQDKVRLDVCVPDPSIAVNPCNGDAVGNPLSDLSSINFDGFTREISGSGVPFDLTIKHEHYVYGGCGEESNSTPDISNALGYGYKFQDLNFGHCFKVNKSKTINANTECVVDIGLCGETEDVYVVCEVSCDNGAKTSSKQKLTFEDGLLKIQPIYEINTGTDNVTRNYTSAKIMTKDKFPFDYNSRVTVCFRVPEGTGLWPAIWMLPFDSSPWPSGGEIDLMEAKGRSYSVDGSPGQSNLVSSAVHFGTQWPDNRYIVGEFYSSNENTFQNYFHSVTLIFQENKIDFYINNENTPHLSIDPTLYPLNQYNYPFNRQYYLIINVAVGGNFDGGRVEPNEICANSACSNFSDDPDKKRLLIDWIEYEKIR